MTCALFFLTMKINEEKKSTTPPYYRYYHYYSHCMRNFVNFTSRDLMGKCGKSHVDTFKKMIFFLREIEDYDLREKILIDFTPILINLINEIIIIIIGKREEEEEEFSSDVRKMIEMLNVERIETNLKNVFTSKV